MRADIASSAAIVARLVSAQHSFASSPPGKFCEPWDAGIRKIACLVFTNVCESPHPLHDLALGI